MKIKYLGTAAAEGLPGLFCNCEVCTTARKSKGKDIRSRSQALIDGKLLIDFPPDTFTHCCLYDIDLTKIQNCLITHMHQDHFYPEDLVMRKPGFSNLDEKYPITFYGSAGTAKEIREYIDKKIPDGESIVKTGALQLYKPTIIGEFKVTALKAWHDEQSFPVIYIIENVEGKCLLYGNDTNYFYDEVWEYLAKSRVRFDFVSLDCTSANVPEMTYIGHMNLNDNIKVKERLIDIGCADENTVFCCNHFSHNGKDVLYESFSGIARNAGFLTSYDGMEVEF